MYLRRLLIPYKVLPEAVGRIGGGRHRHQPAILGYPARAVGVVTERPRRCHQDRL
ncbi:MAG: hypothetical protein K2G52_07835 [Muribaculaceae bacterium]|nr:hypothetical protein [Muribaculaceae bacterium]